ncbi:MAG: dihydropteroate synthase [Holosporaceae bacterium]|jgi:2-amino-4-hydroxy-6-hydroxymethyldihydropteridine diphosphokinase/dihydropteroate synthase|nr:dihydropteroate synthase [Holosporaceae bacterium]
MTADDNVLLLSVGSNVGNRLEHLRNALELLGTFLSFRSMSHVIETAADLLPGSPVSWDLPFLNMVVAADTLIDPLHLLKMLKQIEQKLGRDLDGPRWSPRIIDIDILVYGRQNIYTDLLTIPHRELKNRDFLLFLMDEIGYKASCIPEMNTNHYTPSDNFVLYPRFVGILNVTPDSFSDGGAFLDPSTAEEHARDLLRAGAYGIDIGAQSTRPGYVEVSPAEEISRLDPLLDRCGDIECISIDTYFDEVVQHVLKKTNTKVKWINDQRATLRVDTLKFLADNNIKLVTMLQNMDFPWLKQRIKYLKNLGIPQSNIIIDPGIGFGKSRHDNIRVIKKLSDLRILGCEVLLGVSRKSFITAHSNALVQARDLESIAVACFAQLQKSVDYFRVHNVRDHMRFFVTEHCLTNA